jgi:hypothetical protein
MLHKFLLKYLLLILDVSRVADVGGGFVRACSQTKEKPPTEVN